MITKTLKEIKIICEEQKNCKNCPIKETDCQIVGCEL